MKSVVSILMLMLLSLPSVAREVANIADIKRETRIVADVLESALRQELRREVRVTQVEAEYLAHQGVLASVTLNTPWLKIDEQGEPHFEFHGNISIPEIPAMVNNILQDLSINIAPYEPEALEELRELREAQRELRTDAREERSKLRDERRNLIRADDDDKESIERRIEKIEQQLALIDQEYEQLSQDIEDQYQRLKEHPVAPAAPQPASPEPQPPVDVKAVLAQAMCDYGATLKSLRADEYLTLAVRKGKQSEYSAYRMEHVEACNRGNLSLERFVDLGYHYEG